MITSLTGTKDISKLRAHEHRVFLCFRVSGANLYTVDVMIILYSNMCTHSNKKWSFPLLAYLLQQRSLRYKQYLSWHVISRRPALASMIANYLITTRSLPIGQYKGHAPSAQACLSTPQENPSQGAAVLYRRAFQSGASDCKKVHLLLCSVRASRKEAYGRKTTAGVSHTTILRW